MTARQSTSAVCGSHALVVPSDATVLEGIRRIYCLTAGNLIMQGREAVSVTYPMTAGQAVEFSPTKVMAASTGTYVQHR